jgi:hypothetical protein
MPVTLPGARHEAVPVGINQSAQNAGANQIGVRALREPLEAS